MSARTPFIPNNSRPASSAAHNKDNASSTSVEDAPFAPDINSPLHADMLKLSPSLQIPHSNKGLATSDQKPTANNMPKSTNLNGLLKKSSGSQGGLNLSGRKSNSNQANSANESPSLLSITKTLSGRRDQSGTPSVFAPKPLNAVSAADLLSSSAFKTPTLPNSSVTNLQVTNEAHIPINNEENSHPASQYKFGKAPPQRVLLQGDDSIPGSMIGLIPKHGHRDHDRASKKRGRVELDPDDMIYANHMDSGPAKRYKTNAPMQVGLDTRSYMEGEIECLTHPQSRFSPQLLSSPIERTESPQSARHGPHDYQQHSSPSEHHTTGFDQHQRQYFQRMTLDPAGEGSGGESGIHPPSLSNGSSVSVERGGDALDKLLGCHADAYIEDHMDKYEQLATKWKECSMEEWVKGSDGKPFY